MPKNSKRKADTRQANKDRKQRIEEMRQQQRAAERRKNFMFIGGAIVVAVGLIAAAVIPTWLHDRAQAAKAKVGYQASPSSAEKAAGCLGVHNDPLSPAAQHVTTAIDYSKQKYGDTNGGTPPIPPTGGEHNAISLGDSTRFYPLSVHPRAERAVHDLEHGYVVAWYDKDLPADQVAKLKTMAQDPTLSRMLVVGWNQTPTLPLDHHFVLTSWGRTDRCTSVSSDVVHAFYSAHVNDPIAPEAGLGVTAGATTCDPSKLDCTAGMTATPTDAPSP